MKKVILIDGNNILFRSYYATAYSGSNLKNSKGFPTNALYGFINMLNKIINEENPSYVMIAFDKGKTFRHEKYKDYKGGRGETPEELLQQFPVAKKLTEAMGMTYVEVDNYEADDIIGTYAKKIDEDSEYTGTIISSDKDLLQLISPDVDVKLLKQVGFIRMNEEAFRETYGVDPIRMIDLKALMGDSSDNIPGVKGIGEKTAIALLKTYDNVDNLYEHIDEVKGKTQEKLIADKEACYMSKDLATIYREVPIDTDFEKIKYRGIDTLNYIALLEDLEFYSLIKKLNIPKEVMKENIEEEQDENIDIQLIDTKEKLASLKLDHPFAFYLEILGNNYHRDKKLGIGIYNEEVASFIPFIDTKEKLASLKLDHPFAFYLEILGNNYHRDKKLGIGIYNEEVACFIPFSILKENPSFFDTEIVKYTYDLKKVLVPFLYEDYKIKNVTFDTMVASYLLNKNIKDDIAYLANQMRYNIPFYEKVFGTSNVNSRLKEPAQEVIADLAVRKAKFIFETKERLEQELKEEEAYTLFEKIEMPLIPVLADMEYTGILVDQDYLQSMSLELKAKMDEIGEEIYRLADVRFNLMSPKQLGEVLFDKLALPYPKRIKENERYLTNKEILDKLAPDYPIVEKVLEYRTFSKLYTTYAIGLINEIHPDGRIHTIYTQTLTRTGRLSSISPNLQNIPVRLEYGKLIRKAFIPSPGCILLSSDYSQIELRMFAHMAHASNLIEAFQEGKDIHMKTAMDIFHVKEEEVTKDMRRSAKAVNFGILYGISSFGLSEDLGIDIASAKNFINDYLNTYPGIREYMNEVIEKAHKLGYVKTIMNRKRTIEELSNKNYMIRSQGERMALNTPVQGSAADILKKAMIEIYQAFNEKGLKSKMLLQVHDELVFEVRKEEEQEVRKIVKDLMENTYQLDVPLKVDIETGDNWYEAK